MTSRAQRCVTSARPPLILVMEQPDMAKFMTIGYGDRAGYPLMRVSQTHSRATLLDADDAPALRKR